MRFRNFLILALFTAALLGVSGNAFGQAATGTFTGTITDQKGLAMSGASVVIHNADTGIDHEPVVTNDTGVFVVPFLAPGNYDVTASQAGFASVQHKAITLQVGQTVRVDMVLPVATTQALITVTTEIPILETEKTEQSANINENLVSNLPVSSRRWEQLALLTGGTNPDGSLGAVSFHGLAGLYNNNTVDGAANTTYYDQTTRGGYNEAYVYSSDSVREFAVKSSGFSAELGQAAGGTVNAVTRSGSSQFHGDLFYNGRTPGFNALDPVSKTAGLKTKSVLNQNQWGGSLGGPLIKDKLFFFVTDDGFRKNEPLIVTSGQISPGLASLTCPTVAPGAPAGTTAPTAAQCAAALNYLQNNTEGAFPRIMRQDIELIKLDYQATAADHVFAETNIRDYHLPNPGAYQANAVATFLQDRFVIANWTRVIGNNKVNAFQFQYGVDSQPTYQNLNVSAPAITSNTFTYGNSDSSDPQVENRYQFTDNFSWTRGSHQFKFGVDINKLEDSVRGSSSSDGSYSYANAAVPANISCVAPNPASQSNNAEICAWMEDLFHDNANDTTTVNGISYPLTGQHFVTFSQTRDNVASGPQAFAYDMHTADFAGYAQDTWKLRPNLTLNIGLRYDVELFPTLPNSVALNLAKFAPGSFDIPIFDKFTTVFPGEYDGIQPRVGIAWNFRKNTVLRFGGGEFFAETAGHNLKNVFSGAGESSTTCRPPVAAPGNCINTALTFPEMLFNQNTDVSPGTLSFPGLPANQQPTFILPPPLTPLLVPNPAFTIRGADPTLARPRAWEMTAAVEQQLPWSMNLSVSYVFTRGLHIPRGEDGNIANNIDANVCTSAAASSCGVAITKPYDITNASGAVTQTVNFPLYFQRVDPRTGGIPANQSTINTWYHGMIVTLRKPTHNGLEFLVNYTYSHATDNGSAGAAQLSTVAFDPFNYNLERENSSNDVRHRFTPSVVYAPTFAKKFTSVPAREALDGWSVSASLIAQTGGHYTATASSTASQSVKLCGVALADGSCNYTGIFMGGTELTAANTITLSGVGGGMTGGGIGSTGTAAGSRAGWLAPGSFVLPNLYDVDMRLAKEFSIKERYHIEARIEAFNLFNSTLVQGVLTPAFNYVKPNATLNAPLSGALKCPAGAITCMAPRGTFQQTSLTSGNLLGARQMQAGIRFDF